MRCSRLLLPTCLAITQFLVAQSNPVPLVNQPLVPSAASPGGPGFTLTLNGAEFVPTSVATWNSVPLPTTFVNQNQLTAIVSAADVSSIGTASVRVVNPGPGGGDSNQVPFTVTNPTSLLNFQAVTLSSVPLPIAVAAGDFNHDGKADLAVVSQAPSSFCNYQFHGVGSIAILLSNGDGTFTQTSTLCFPDELGIVPEPFITINDLGQGNVELVAETFGGLASQELISYSGSSDGTFSGPNVLFGFRATISKRVPQSTRRPAKRNSLAPADFIFGLSFGDFGGTGAVEPAISFLDTFGTLQVLVGSQDLVFLPQGGTAGELQAGDFNNDGHLDVAAIVDGHVLIFISDGSGGFQESMIPTPINGSQLVVGDFNGDGILDIATSINGTLAIFLGNGDGTFTQKAQPVSNMVGGLVAGDFNGDSKLDLATMNSGVSVLLGNGNGTFQPEVVAAGVTGNGPAIGDFRGNGRTDLAVTNSSDGTVTVILQVPIQSTTALTSSLSPSIFGQPVTLTATMTPHGFGSPTGSVTFRDRGTVLGTAGLSNGIATLTTSMLGAGTHHIVAAYGGDSNYLASTSNSLRQIVNKAATRCQINATPVYVGARLFYRFKADTSSATPTPIPPAGRVAFWDSAYSEILLGRVPLVNGTASLVVHLSPEPNPQWIKALYAGDVDFQGCQSPYIAIFQ